MAQDSPSESKKLKTKELFLKSCIMMLKAANYKPYLDLESKNDEVRNLDCKQLSV